MAKTENPDRRLDYENLVYACNRCNSLKWKITLYLDPTRVAFDKHLRVRDDGQIEGLSPEGEKLIALLDLAHVPAIQVREETLWILRAKRERPSDPVIHEIFLKRFGYPTDLPDLTKRAPPGGNSRPAGIDNCHYARRIRGQLPEFY